MLRAAEGRDAVTTQQKAGSHDNKQNEQVTECVVIKAKGRAAATSHGESE